METILAGVVFFIVNRQRSPHCWVQTRRCAWCNEFRGERLCINFRAHRRSDSFL